MIYANKPTEPCVKMIVSGEPSGVEQVWRNNIASLILWASQRPHFHICLIALFVPSYALYLESEHFLCFLIAFRAL
jgi:hypothetical protein